VALWTNEGLRDKTRSALGIDAQAEYVLSLYVNMVTPGVGTVTADFVECSLPGYLPFPFVPSDWTVAVASGLATATYPTLAFTFGANSGGITVFGYWVGNGLTGRSAWAESFPTPFAVPAEGGTLTIALTWYDTNG
jgi:hypothetical protein